jgi:hypothetical protein
MRQMAIVNMVGLKFGRLTVMNFSEINKWREKVWVCKCDCGNYTEVSTAKLRKGNTTSCGCYRKECVERGLTRKYNIPVYYKKQATRLYKCWQDMKARCNNPKNKRYENYGGRGIVICNDWLNNYEVFQEWALQNGYSDKLTLDRINVDGNYELSNCRWVAIEIQANNKTNCMYIEFQGKTQSLSQWCKELNLNYGTISSRINRNKMNPLIALELVQQS